LLHVRAAIPHWRTSARVGIAGKTQNALFAWQHGLCIGGEQHEWRQRPLRSLQEAALLLALQLHIVGFGGDGQRAHDAGASTATECGCGSERAREWRRPEQSAPLVAFHQLQCVVNEQRPESSEQRRCPARLFSTEEEPNNRRPFAPSESAQADKLFAARFSKEKIAYN
jgi:hypothetical protein